jgi:hypothetical protein
MLALMANNPTRMLRTMNQRAARATMDLRDWPDSALASLEWMLNELSIPYAWNPAGMLLVPTNHSKEVNDLITELEAIRSPHGTTPAVEAHEHQLSSGTQSDGT